MIKSPFFTLCISGIFLCVAFSVISCTNQKKEAETSVNTRFMPDREETPLPEPDIELEEEEEVLSGTDKWSFYREDIPLFNQYGIYLTDGIYNMDPKDKDDFLLKLKEEDEQMHYSILIIGEDTYELKPLGELELSLEEEPCGRGYEGRLYSDGEGGHILGGIATINRGTFPLVTDKYINLLPDNYEFTFNGFEYEVFVTATYSENEYDTAENVTIRFRRNKEDTSQILGTIPKLHYTTPGIVFIGDLDGDGVPDLILSECMDYEDHRNVLYLSTLAEGEEIVKRVALDIQARDC